MKELMTGVSTALDDGDGPRAHDEYMAAAVNWLANKRKAVAMAKDSEVNVTGKTRRPRRSLRAMM